MSSPAPQFESKDLAGSTSQYASTVGTSQIPLPPAAGAIIAYAFFRCASDNSPITKRLLYSLDGGVTFGTLSPGEYVGWPVRGGLTQVIIKGNVAAVAYEVILNHEPVGEPV